MAVNLAPPAGLEPIAGVRLASVPLGLRSEPRDDLALLEVAPGANVAGVFTQSSFAAAPVTLAREHLAHGAPRYLVINAGNANAATGRRGIEDARECCAMVAALGGASTRAVLPFSTGVIGEHLHTDAFRSALPAAFASLAADGWDAAARAIMTTDTVPKACSTRLELAGGQVVHITGMAKGVGMICPNMATMLAFVATDAGVQQGLLDALLRRVVARTFNRVTVDGDTSTNDACMLIATGAGPGQLSAAGDDLAVLERGIESVCRQLAHAIVRDGEGATKFVTIRCGGAATEAEAAQVAYTIAHSPLVKTALFASDANWGRLVMAVGRAGVEGLDPDGVNLWLDDVRIVEAGGRAAGYDDAMGATVLARDEFTIGVDLGRGDAATEVWTCDFSYDYVRINAEYRS